MKEVSEESDRLVATGFKSRIAEWIFWLSLSLSSPSVTSGEERGKKVTERRWGELGEREEAGVFQSLPPHFGNQSAVQQDKEG